MRILAISFFDPASVVLSHRDLMRAAGHDFRLAVVRAYTERQRQADYVCEQLVESTPGVGVRQLKLEKLNPDLGALREFAASADVIQFHPGIGHGDGDWASVGDRAVSPDLEIFDALNRLQLPRETLTRSAVWFFHGSRSVWTHLDYYRAQSKLGIPATSTIDYATELDATYLPPFVNVGDLRAKPREDDDPLLIAHTPTDRIACSTEEFLGAARRLGIPVRLGEGLSHAEVLKLKAGCNVGFDHLRGTFSTNTLENAALGLVPLFALNAAHRAYMIKEGINSPIGYTIVNASDLGAMMNLLDASPSGTRGMQRSARLWWESNFSAAPVTRRLTRFYEGL